MLEKACKLFQQGKIKEAEEIFNKLITKDPKNLKIHYYLALIAKKKGELHKAFDFGNKCLSLNPEFLDGYNFLGGIFYENGDVDKAISYFEKP